MVENKLYFITPSYNASNHLTELYESLLEQTNRNWNWIILNDMSTDNTYNVAKDIQSKDMYNRISVINHIEKKYALKGIYESLNILKNTEDEDKTIIAVIDGDDALCNENTVDLILKNYNNSNLDALWTAHSWDINGQNISQELPGNVNPYHYPWVSSHLKTFKLETFLKINQENFKDFDGNWFKRGYDQALYLPILHLAKERKFINEICYLYRINSDSLKVREEVEREQLNTVKLVRSRGYIK